MVSAYSGTQLSGLDQTLSNRRVGLALIVLSFLSDELIVEVSQISP
jgi:hypothetical protein